MVLQYRVEQAFEVETLVRYYTYWKEKRLKPSLKSEDIPVYERGKLNGAKKLVAKNFWPGIMNQNTDVFVLFLYGDCGKACSHFKHVLDYIAKDNKNYTGIEFYTVDLKINDILDLDIEAFPTFGAYLMEKKEEMIKFSSEYISITDVMQFIDDTIKDAKQDTSEEKKDGLPNNNPNEEL